jgi:hypothetical protein
MNGQFRASQPLASTIAPYLQMINYLADWRHLNGTGNTPSRLTERSLNQRPVDRMTVLRT